jgi:cytoskeletal protein CcmA (bactofilin family)
MCDDGRIWPAKFTTKLDSFLSAVERGTEFSGRVAIHGCLHIDGIVWGL